MALGSWWSEPQRPGRCLDGCDPGLCRACRMAEERGVLCVQVMGHSPPCSVSMDYRGPGSWG